MRLSREKISKSFSSDWWDYFLKTTNDLTQTQVFEDCLTKEETQELRSYVLEAIGNLSKLRTNKFGYRVYADGSRWGEKDMDLIYDYPPMKGETIENWTSRIFGLKKFGIIINSGERFSNGLSKEIGLKIEPLLKKIGFPRQGINFSIFIGNYDRTPIGIHRDLPGEDVMHFHLGPDDKIMYTWDESKFKDLTDNQNVGKQDFDYLESFANIFRFKEGDIYFMPEGKFHIGRQNGLSIAVTIWRYNYTKKRLILKLVNNILEEYTTDSPEILNPDCKALDDTSHLDEMFTILNMPDNAKSLPYIDVLKLAYKDLRYSINSNAGYRRTPIRTKTSNLISEISTIKGENPYKILFRNYQDNNEVTCFVRGTKINCKKLNGLEKIILLLNSYENIKVSDLLLQFENKDDKIYFLELLNKFYQSQGVVICL